MKANALRFVLAAAAFAGGAAVVYWCSHTSVVSNVSKAPQPNPGIVRVLTARVDALHLAEVKDEPGHYFIAKYNQALQRIGAEDCPRDFELAWIDYKVVWHNRVHHHELKGLEFAAETPGATLPSGADVAPVSSNRTVPKSVTDPLPYWAQVRKQAAMFNSEVPADTINF